MGLVLDALCASAARVLRGAKSPEELAEETAAREQILAFFKKQFARTDVPSIVSPKSNVPATATTPKAATSASAPPPPSTPTVRSGARGQAAPARGGGIEERFRQFDRNADGKLTPDEFPRVGVFRQMDTDNDGVLTLDEVRAYYSGRRQKAKQVEGR